MAKRFPLNPNAIKATICLFFLTTTFLIANSARILEEVDSQPQVINNNPSSVTTGSVSAAQVGPATTNLPSGQIPAAATAPATAGAGADTGDEDVNADPPVPATEEAPPADNVIPPPTVASPAIDKKPEHPQPEAQVLAFPEGAPAVAAPVTAAANSAVAQPSLSFFMHDIIGGSHPSARVVAGIVANTDVTGLPFSKLNNKLFPITGGIPLVNAKLNGIITNNNLPHLVGLGGAQSSTVFQNRGTNNVVSGGKNQPFVSAGNLPAGLTVQKLMFGSVTVIDDQLTEGQDLGSAVIGTAQGFYLASSLDGTSQSLVLTILMHSEEQHHDEVEDTISFFGVHRTASPGSEIAVIGGTGKYENASGYAVLETLLKEDQHTTDGVDTILHFNVYLTE